MSSSKPKQEVTKFQAFETVTIHRGLLKNAPYNPRIMDEDSLKRLKKVVKKIGLIEPPVWNKRSGNIVGGHQRLKILDSLNRSENYSLTVAQIDINDKEEVEANIALNNPSMQGEFDIEALAELQENHNINFLDLGFTDSDIDLLFDGEMSKLLEDSDGVSKAKDTLTEIKKERKNASKQFKENNSGDFYFVVVCESEKDKTAILKKLKTPSFETYISSNIIKNVLKDK